MLDEATAAAEAMTLARRVWQGSDDACILVDAQLHPHVKAVIQTRAKPLNIKIVESIFADEDFKSEIFAAIIAYPESIGRVKDLTKIIEKVKSKQGLAIVDCDLLALTLLLPFKTMLIDLDPQLLTLDLK
jgi:glycine dehydrogenase